MNSPVAIIRNGGFQLECTSQFQQQGFAVRSAMSDSMIPVVSTTLY